MIKLTIGKFSLQPTVMFGPSGEKDFAEHKCYQICHQCIGNPTSVYAVAGLEYERDGYYSLQTYGDRPWKIEGSTPDEFWKFATTAMKLLNH